jgi:CO/xanthine dehydrogenase FAD-binding subunit
MAAVRRYDAPQIPGQVNIIPSKESGMNLSFVTEVLHGDVPAPSELGWQVGDAWLAGGTWLFSEPQDDLRRLIDLHAYGWPSLEEEEEDAGPSIGATCTIAELDTYAAQQRASGWGLVRECCASFLSSFKVWNAATVGGNICMSLPAGPMISMAAALEATYTLQDLAGNVRKVSPLDFTTGNHQNILQSAEMLRTIHLPAAAMTKRWAFRRMSLTHLGRSSSLLIGTLDPGTGTFLLTVTAATTRPHQLRFDVLPDWPTLQQRLRSEIADSDYYDDVHGTPAYRKAMTHYFANGILNELAGTLRKLPSTG